MMMNEFLIPESVLGWDHESMSSPGYYFLHVSTQGLLMPIGILTEVYFGFPPYLVLLGATAIVIATVWLGLAVMRMRMAPGADLEEHPLRA